jgi:hypothetical protein
MGYSIAVNKAVMIYTFPLQSRICSQQLNQFCDVDKSDVNRGNLREISQEKYRLRRVLTVADITLQKEDMYNQRRSE